MRNIAERLEGRKSPAKWVITLALLLALSPSALGKRSDDDTSIRNLVEKFFNAYQREDLDVLMSLWSEKSPELAAGKKSFEQTFAANEKIQVQNFAVRKVIVEGEKATARVAVEMSAVDAKSGRTAEGFGKKNRNLHLVKESGEWKIWQYGSSEDELAASLADAGTAERRRELIQADKELVSPELVRVLAARGRRFRTQGNYSQALSIYGLTEEVAAGLGDKNGKAIVLNGIGDIHLAQANYPQAMDYYQKGLKISEETGDKSGIGSALVNTGIVQQRQGNYAQALECHLKALKVSEEISNKDVMSRALNNIGNVHSFQGNWGQALEYYQKSLAISEERGDKPGIGGSLNNLGIVYKTQGHYAQALDCFQRSLKLSEERGDKSVISRTLGNIGVIYHLQGNYSGAIEYHHRSLKISEEIGDKDGIGRALSNIGSVHTDQSDYTQAREYYQKSLKVAEEIGDRVGISRVLVNLGDLRQSQGNSTEALEYYHRSLKVSEEINYKDAFNRALYNIGSIHLLGKTYAQALEYFQKSLKGSEEAGDKDSIGYSLVGIGEVDQLQGRNLEAVDFAARAAEIGRQTGSLELVCRANTVLGEAYHALNELLPAQKALAEAIAAVEAARKQVAGGEQQRQRFFAIRIHAYYEMIDVLIDQQNSSEALSFAERARSRSLLETLAQGQRKFRQGVEPGLLEREQSLRDELASASERQTRLLGSKGAEKQTEDIKREIEARLNEYQEVQRQIRATSPRYAALTQPRALSVREIQQEVLDADTLLLEYAIGEKRGHLWAVTTDSLRSYEVGNQEEIEKAAKQLYDLVTARNRHEPNETAAQRQSRLLKAQSDYSAAAARLSQLLLGPVAAQLGKRRLLIAGDGALNYLPFALLPVPGVNEANPDQQGRRSRPLIADHEIISLPSASVLSVVRSEMAGRKPATKLIAVLADPVFDKDDARVRPVTRSTAGEPNKAERSDSSDDLGRLELRRSAEETGLSANGSFPRLLFTRREAEAILDVARKTSATTALDFDASKATATSPQMKEYRIIHFATHGLLNNEHPELSGLVFSLVDREGKEQNGFVRLIDIYNMELNADLVVLSACQTALGKQVRGEGLIGLTRGMMYAGAARVMASLWKVDDEATAEMMKKFYEGMLKEGKTVAESLRSAQVWMRGQKRWESPYYWAGFVLQGEWR